MCKAVATDMITAQHLIYFVCFYVSMGIALEPQNPNKNLNLPEDQKQEVLPPCQACRTLTNSFKKGMTDTSRGKFEGGDASWEESRLGAYADSELRLIEIQEKLCSDVEKASEQCRRLVEEHEHVIEEWWFKKKKTFPDIYYYLCIDILKVCCPENHYGPDCEPCAGGIVNPCNGHGQCKGAGTRKGSGLCRCDSGYTGDFCEKCKIGYYNDTSDDSWACMKCDKSCKGHCRKGGPKGCEVCADGYQYAMDLGCIECDKSCDGCKGDGPDMCDKCAEGYSVQDSICIENKVWKRSLHIEIARYATYLGLCIATCIIFRRNVFMASVIGLFVAVYIGLSEYTVGEWDKRSFMKSLKSLLLL